MTTDIILRKMNFNDLEFIHRIRNHENTRVFLRNTSNISLEETQDWFHREKPSWFIIENQGLPVGYIRTSQDTGESICIGCDIDMDKRGMGFANAAYLKIIEELYKKDYIVIWLEVFRNNNIAMNLYKKLGFVEINSSIKDGRQRVTMVHVRNKND